jgi:tight adherence protein C
MSNLWLLLAMAGTFMSVLVVFMVVDMRARERNRPVALLQSQVGPVEGATDVRPHLEGNAFERIVLPTFRKIGRTIVRVTPFDMAARINEKIVLAGNPEGWDAERVVALKLIGGVAGFIGGLMLMAVLPLSGALGIAFVGILALLGYTIPSTQVSSMANRRQKMVRKQLADVMDLLTISVEAGLGFDAAIAQVVRNVPGPLAEELARLLQEIQIGASRADAFRHMGERTNVQELQGFVLSMIQADMFGVSIANVLRAQSRELRHKRRQRAEEIAQKIPVKLLFPMIFMVLPALFVVVLGPGAIMIFEQFFGPGGTF